MLKAETRVGSFMTGESYNFIIAFNKDTIIWFKWKENDGDKNDTTSTNNSSKQRNYIFITVFSVNGFFLSHGDSWTKLMKEATSLKPHYSNFYTIKVFFIPVHNFYKEKFQTKQLKLQFISQEKKNWN